MYIDYKLMGKRLKDCRKKNGITQSYLAEKIEKSAEYISKIENGKAKPSLEVLVALCHHIGLDVGLAISGTVYKSDDYLKSEIYNLVKDCTPEQIKLISELSEVVLSYKIDKKLNI